MRCEDQKCCRPHHCQAESRTKPRSVLVTGASGFIGWNLCRHLTAHGHEVYSLGRCCENPIEGMLLGTSWTVEDGQVNIPGLVSPWSPFDALPRIDAVVHLAANTDPTASENEVMGPNVRDAKALLDALDWAGIYTVYASSAAVYGNQPARQHEDMDPQPLSPYAKSKVDLERLAPRHSCGLRFSNVYGPGEDHKGRYASMVSQLAKADSDKPVKLFHDGQQRRDFVYVKDVCEGIRLCLERRPKGIFNMGSGTSHSFNELVAMLGRQAVYTPCPYQHFQTHTELDVTKAKRAFGYNPTWTLKDGIADYITA